jgi:hypothetical protein
LFWYSIFTLQGVYKSRGVSYRTINSEAIRIDSKVGNLGLDAKKSKKLIGEKNIIPIALPENIK